MRVLANALLAVLVAPRCAACDGALDAPLEGPVCAACWRSIHELTPPVCDACGDPLPSWRTISGTRGLCPRCRRRPRAVDRGRAAGVYDGSLRAIVHALKYDGRRSLAKQLAGLMKDRGAEILDGADFVVPVPLHPSRRRSRGFNQAADLASHLGLPIHPALARVRRTRPQLDLPASERHRNVRDAFALAHPRWPRESTQPVRGRCILLVDDVCTTGATLEACARVLKAAGAREVRALTAARVVSVRP